GWRLERANSVHEAVWGVAFLLGPGVGGVLIATVGAVGTLWVTAAGFALSLVMVSLVRLPGAGTPLPRDRPAGIWRGTREGLSYVWGDRLLRTLAVFLMVFVAVYLPIEGIVLPTYFVEAGAPARLGAVVMAMSAGGVLGALAYAAWGHLVARRTAFVVALVGACLAVLGMSVLPTFPALLALAAATGLLYGPVDPLANYAMQTRTPEHLRGRVVGVMTSAQYAAGPVGYLLVGPLVERAGPETAFVVLAVALLAVGVATAALPVLRGLDDEPRYPPSPDAVPAPPAGSIRGPLPLGEQDVPRLRAQ
ncbi:MAG TPA: MFS transporter, partial [Jiangellales bacterium]|nr:MFS transporter [Jiangellales bacterium]